MPVKKKPSGKPSKPKVKRKDNAPKVKSRYELRGDATFVENILKAIRNGNPITNACEFNGITRGIYDQWMSEADGHNGNEVEARERGEEWQTTTAQEFQSKVMVALATSRNRNILLIQSAATEDWRAAAWHLERTYPEEFSMRGKIEVTGKGGGAIKTENDNVNVNVNTGGVLTGKSMEPEQTVEFLEKFYASRAQYRAKRPQAA